MSKLIDETGNRYGRLIVIDYAGTDKYHVAFWLCKCACGNDLITLGTSLRRGATQSCGCLWKEAVSLPKGIATRNFVLRGYKRRAKARGYKWELSNEQFDLLINSPCRYCGSINQTECSAKIYNGGFKYTGIDRLDNDEGYVEDNVVPCCSTCNYMKRCMSVDDFIDHAAKITNYNKENSYAHSPKKR